MKRRGARVECLDIRYCIFLVRILWVYVLVRGLRSVVDVQLIEVAFQLLCKRLFYQGIAGELVGVVSAPAVSRDGPSVGPLCASSYRSSHYEFLDSFVKVERILQNI